MNPIEFVPLSPEEGLLTAGRNSSVSSRTRGRGSVWDERRQSRNGLCCHREELRIALNADALVADCYGRGNCRTAAHERIEDYAFPERKRSPYDLAHEGLRLERRVRGNVSFRGTCRRTANHITEGLVVSNPPETTSLPFPEIVLHATLAGFSEESPRFPARAGHHRHFSELLVSVLGAVACTRARSQSSGRSVSLAGGPWNTSRSGFK